jgi:hypothetical protein
MKTAVLKGNLYAGTAVLALSAALLASGSSLMQTWFYSFAWWSTILILDSVNYRLSGTSFLSRSFKYFLICTFISVPVWLVFELYNLALKNWSYHHLPPETGIRWLGYFIAFATVVPALKELADLWASILKKKNLSLIRIPSSSPVRQGFIAAGIISLTFPIFIPKWTFPLLWVGFIFLLDPINFTHNRSSFLRDLSQNQWNRFFSWVLAGMTAGFLWEFFNFWSGSHWKYSIPFFNFGKIFQMPVLGYFGFVPFALEIFAFLALFHHLHNRLKRRPWTYSFFALILLIFDGWVFHLIDLFTRVQ